MPAFSTHYLFAEELAGSLETPAGFSLNKNCLYIGAQGPDIFFFHRALPWQKGKTLRKAGSAMHREKCGRIIDCFAEYIDGLDEPDAAKSYVYGFIMHYALDRICHPYIYFIQNTITQKFGKMNPNSVHNMIELSLDSLLLSEKKNAAKPKELATESMLDFNQEELRECSSVLASAGKLFEPCGFSAADAACAVKDTRAAQRLLYDASGRRERFLKLAERLAFPFTKNFRISSFLRTNDLEKAVKYANINNRKWRSPYSGEVRSESFAELYELAKADAAEMIKRFNAGQTGAQITENISFLTGVKIK